MLLDAMGARACSQESGGEREGMADSYEQAENQVGIAEVAVGERTPLGCLCQWIAESCRCPPELASQPMGSKRTAARRKEHNMSWRSVRPHSFPMMLNASHCRGNRYPLIRSASEEEANVSALSWSHGSIIHRG